MNIFSFPLEATKKKKKEKEEKTVCSLGAVTKSKPSGVILYYSWKSQTPKGGRGTLFLGGDVPLGPLAYAKAGAAEFCYPILD